MAEQRIDWRTAFADYSRAESLQPGNWQYAESAGYLAHETGNYAAATSFRETALSIVTSAFGADAPEAARTLTYLAHTYKALAHYVEAEPLYRRAIEIDEKALGKDRFDVKENVAPVRTKRTTLA